MQAGFQRRNKKAGISHAAHVFSLPLAAEALANTQKPTAFRPFRTFLFSSLCKQASNGEIKKPGAIALGFSCLRRERDSNPRGTFGAYTLSRRAS